MRVKILTEVTIEKMIQFSQESCVKLNLTHLGVLLGECSKFFGRVFLKRTLVFVGKSNRASPKLGGALSHWEVP
ncbi:hypothetical protein EBQ74_02785 [bacterium]|nr:hypothetical protein [bacterium]